MATAVEITFIVDVLGKVNASIELDIPEDTPYVRPQENANRCDTHWVKFSGASKQLPSLKFSSGEGGLLSVSAWPYSQQQLAATEHNFELPRGENLSVNIDHLPMGVGGDNSWSKPVMEKYQIATGRTYQWNFILEMVR